MKLLDSLPSRQRHAERTRRASSPPPRHRAPPLAPESVINAVGPAPAPAARPAEHFADATVHARRPPTVDALGLRAPWAREPHVHTLDPRRTSTHFLIRQLEVGG